MIKSGVPIVIFFILKYITANGNLGINKETELYQCGIDLFVPCGLSGTWKEDKGSYIDVTCGNGSLHGKYRTPVINGEDVYEFSGKYIVTGADGQDRIVAFLVPWNNSSSSGNSNSSTSHTGIYYNSEDVIYTNYVLTLYKERSKLREIYYAGTAVFRRE